MKQSPYTPQRPPLPPKPASVRSSTASPYDASGIKRTEITLNGQPVYIRVKPTGEVAGEVAGECHKNKWHPSEPQCNATDVRRSPIVTGNATDEWTWCREHIRLRSPKDEDEGRWTPLGDLYDDEDEGDLCDDEDEGWWTALGRGDL